MPEQITGDVNAQRDAILGNVYNITNIFQAPPFVPPPDLAAQRAAYLDFLRSHYQALDLKGIPQLEAFTRQMLLEEVYVPLLASPELPPGETWERRLAGRAFGGFFPPAEDETPPDAAGNGPPSDPQAGRPVLVEEALGKHARVVVLGDPGSGKSTLLKVLALRLAAQEQAPLPILVPLNSYAARLAREDLSLQAFLPAYFAGLSAELAGDGLAALFDQALANGQAVILLDGLDEVQQERAYLVNKVETFAEAAARRGSRVLVTSRIVGYRDQPLDPKRWERYTLLDFDRPAIEQFARQWCLAFERGTLGDTPQAHANAEVEQRALLEAIDANTGVARLAANPLLLTILALIKRQGVSLPNRRVELYEVYLQTLISAWNKARALDHRQVGPDVDYLEVVGVLGPLALWLREENPTAGLVSEAALLRWLTGYYMGEDWGLPRGPAAEKGRGFLQSIRRYSSLVLERGQGQFGFIHLTFEEMLAAYGLYQKGQLRLEDSLAVIQQHLADPAWRETLLLAVGVWGVTAKNPRAAGEVVRAMLCMDCPPDERGQNLLLAGACLEDVSEVGVGRSAAREVTEALVKAMRDRSLPPPVRRDAGFCLGRLGWTPPGLDDFIPIQPGPFRYGDDRRRVVIEKPFSMAKYPVTNRQYRAFIDAGGYEQPEYWGADGWAWRTGTYDSKAPDDYKTWLAGRPPERRSLPYYWNDRRWNNPLAPVVGVSCFEAEAYCSWLAAGTGRAVRLPGEQEWERAARGIDGREYPWGEQFDPQRLNCAEFWAGKEDLSDSDEWLKWLETDSFKTASTTVVGMFADENHLDALCDLAGNTWEWTESWYDREKMMRVVRGGSWSSDRGVARCAYRGGLVPDNFGDTLGFRVLSPG